MASHKEHWANRIPQTSYQEHLFTCIINMDTFGKKQRTTPSPHSVSPFLFPLHQDLLKIDSMAN